MIIRTNFSRHAQFLGIRKSIMNPRKIILSKVYDNTNEKSSLKRSGFQETRFPKKIRISTLNNEGLCLQLYDFNSSICVYLEGEK